LFDSTELPEEVIDCVMVDSKVLETPDGQNFAKAICETYYRTCAALNDKDTHDEVLTAIGDKFCSLDLPAMEDVLKKTRLYDTPAKAKRLFADKTFREKT